MKTSQFKTEPKLEVEGVPVVFDHDEETGEPWRVTIRYAGGRNAEYSSRVGNIPMSIRKKSDGEAFRQTMIGIYADTIIVDWDPCTGEDGKDFPCTLENKKKLLGYSWFLTKTQVEANDISNFRTPAETVGKS